MPHRIASIFPSIADIRRVRSCDAPVRPPLRLGMFAFLWRLARQRRHMPPQKAGRLYRRAMQHAERRRAAGLAEADFDMTRYVAQDARGAHVARDARGAHDEAIEDIICGENAKITGSQAR